MNKLALTIFGTVLCGAISVFSQDFGDSPYHSTRYWCYSYSYYYDFSPNHFADPDADVEIFCVGEKERGGKTYQMALRVQGYRYDCPSSVDTLLYRWEGKRAYAEFESMCNVFYDGDGSALRQDYPCEGGEVVLYDFTLSAGDIFGCTTVREVSTITLGEKKRKLITLTTGKRLLEGIGSLSGGFFEYMREPLWERGNEGICSVFLLSYFEDGQWLITQSFEEAYAYLLLEEDVQDYLRMGIDGKYRTNKADSPIHDLQGRRLSGIPQKGVYIRNGRKYVR